jgi:hypothetical protein
MAAFVFLFMESYRVFYCKLNEDISGKKRKLQCVITLAWSYKINGNNIAGEWETIEYKTDNLHVKKH